MITNRYHVKVKGVQYRIQRASKEFRCFACPDPVNPGLDYARVMYRQRNRPRVVETYHVSCFVDEFTDGIK